MLRLLKLTITLSAVLSVLIVLARVAAPPDVYGFPLNSINLTPDCQLPCWHGITPGITTVGQMEAIMNGDPAYERVHTADKQYPSRDWQPRSVENGGTADGNTVHFTLDNQAVVSHINLSGQVQAGELLLTFKAPLGISQQCEQWLSLRFPGSISNLARDSSDSSRPLHISETVQIWIDTPVASFRFDPWRGFRVPAPIDVYSSCSGE